MASHDKNVAPDLAAIPPLMEWIEQRCQEAGIAGELTLKLMLAIEEAATNVVSYAFAEMPPPHRFRVCLDIDDKCCAAELADNGRSTNRPCVSSSSRSVISSTKLNIAGLP